MSSSTTAVVLPGDAIERELLPIETGKSKSLILGPGVEYQPPTNVHAISAGFVVVDRRRSALWLDSNGAGRYVPVVGDLVVATVHHSSVDNYHCVLTDHAAHASLPQLAFEGATKKTRPVLQPGSLVYARVSLASRNMDPELECVHPSTGKSEGLGELKGGMIFGISIGMARRMLMTKPKQEGCITILDDLAEKGMRFEVAVGRNGRLWVSGENAKTTLLVGKAVQQTDREVARLSSKASLLG